jgi:hypothetical protein
MRIRPFTVSCTLLVAATLPFLGGCVDSLHPLYTCESSIVPPTSGNQLPREPHNPCESTSVPGLVGKWVSTDKKDESPGWFTIQANQDGTYELNVEDPDTHIVEESTIHLVRLQKKLFADLRFHTESLNGTDVELPLAVLPMHMILRVSLSGDTLELAALSHDWLEKQLAMKKISIPHVYVDRGDAPFGWSDILLTAPTADLRNFVAQVADDPGAFDETSGFLRAK